MGPGLLQCSLSQGCCLTASRLGLALGSTVSRLRMRASQPGDTEGGGGCRRPCMMLRSVAGMLLGRVRLCMQTTCHGPGWLWRFEGLMANELELIRA